MTTKFQPPKIFVDNVLETTITNYVNDEALTQLPDRILTNIVNTAIGIEMTRKIIAFSQQDNDNCDNEKNVNQAAQGVGSE